MIISPEAEVLHAAHALTALIEAEPSRHQVQRDRDLRGPFRKIKLLARRRFRAQRKAVLDSHALTKLKDLLDRAGHVKEAEDPERTRLESDIANEIAAQIYMLPTTAKDSETFTGAIKAAVDSGGVAAADMTATAEPETESFIAEYLKDAGFSRLTGDIDQTTVNNLGKAIADAYESGLAFDGIVQAVKDSFADANDVRAHMIAQTELNDAYNQSLMHFGQQAGAKKKSWLVDLAPCIVCIENAADGEIGLDEEFASGDDAPPAHVNCMCSIMVHA